MDFTSLSIDGIPPSLLAETLSVESEGSIVNIQIVRMKDSCWVCLKDGVGPVKLGSITCAMPTRFDSVPLSSQLLDGTESDDTFVTGMSQRISKKFNIQCFVSSDMTTVHGIDLFKLIESKIISSLVTLFE
jgi:hypothetical protein